MNNLLKNLLVARIASHLAQSKHVAVGASSPIPAAAALLAQARNPNLRVSLLGSEKFSAFTDGGRELFDCAAQGRIDTFFLSGVQIDGAANINLIGTGDYPRMDTRYAGSFGSAYLYHQVPRVILFCWAHSPKTLVSNVDFISAAGPRNDGVWRRGVPTVLLTDRCEFKWTNRDVLNRVSVSPTTSQPTDAQATPPESTGEFELESLHPGETLANLIEQTGFSFKHTAGGESPVTSVDDSHDCSSLADIEEILKSTVLPRLEETYPRFVERYLAGVL